MLKTSARIIFVAMPKKPPPDDPDNVVSLKPQKGDVWRKRGVYDEKKKASGIPASGISATGNQAEMGWGGPSRASGLHPAKLADLSHAEQVARLRQILSDLAEGAQTENIRMQASIALLNRIEGAPVQKQIVANVDSVKEMSDPELNEALEKIKAG